MKSDKVDVSFLASAPGAFIRHYTVIGHVLSTLLLEQCLASAGIVSQHGHALNVLSNSAILSFALLAQITPGTGLIRAVIYSILENFSWL